MGFPTLERFGVLPLAPSAPRSRALCGAVSELMGASVGPISPISPPGVLVEPTERPSAECQPGMCRTCFPALPDPEGRQEGKSQNCLFRLWDLSPSASPSSFHRQRNHESTLKWGRMSPRGRDLGF